jgi:hypothetical protein
MENFDNSKEDLLSSDYLKVDEWSGNNLKNAATWAKTIAIIGAVIGAIVFCVVLFLGNKLLVFSYMLSESSSIALVISVIIFLAVIGLLVVMLFRFSSNVSDSVNSQDVATFEKGIDGLKIFFIASGVLSILYVLLHVINFISAL